MMNMNNSLYSIRAGARKLMLLLAPAFLLFASCEKTPEEELTVADRQLVATWQLFGSEEYWRFDAEHTGETWDLSDDVQEGEGTNLTWSVTGHTLAITLLGEMGQRVGYYYDITSINDARLTWVDSYGNSRTFTKVK